MRTDEIELFRKLKRTAIVVLLMIRLDHPTGEQEIAEVLEINQETARGYLRELSGMGVVAKIKRYNGYILTELGRQMVLPIGEPASLFESGSAENPRLSAENPRSNTPIIINTYSINREEVINNKRAGSAENPRSNNGSAENPRSPNMDALRDVGIYANDRTRRLAEQDWITPEYIRAHALKLNKPDAPALLLTILESGAPAPELTGAGHLAGCKCAACEAEKWHRQAALYNPVEVEG